MPKITDFKESLAIQLVEASEGTGAVWDVVVIEEGFSKNGAIGPDKKFYQRYYSRDRIKDILEALKEKTIKAFTYGAQPGKQDHLPGEAKREKPFGLVDNQVGFFKDFKLVETAKDGVNRAAVAAKFYFDERASELRAAVKNAWDKGVTDYMGFSIDALGQSELGEAEGKLAEIVTTVKSADSVDIVSEAAAGGRFVRLAASMGIHNTRGEDMDKLKELLLKLVESVAPDLLKDMDKETLEATQLTTVFEEAVKQLSEDKLGERMLKSRLTEAHELIKGEKYDEAGVIFTEILEGKRAEPVVVAPASIAAPAAIATPSVTPGNGNGDLKESFQRLDGIEKRIRESECRAELVTQLAESKLPELTQKKIEAQFRGAVFETKTLKESIDRERAYLGELSKTGNVSVPGQDIRIRESEQDKLTLGLTGFFMGEDLKGEDGKIVPRFRSFRRAWSTITGQPEASARKMLRESRCYIPAAMREEDPDQVRMLESMTTSSWGEIMGDSVTRAMLKDYNDSPLQAWRLVVSDVVPISDFRTQRRMLVGGYSDLSTVAQGGVYQPLTSPTDAENTYSISKKGGTEDLTEEMVANDDVGAIRRIPQKMSRAAIRTLYKAVFDILSDNTATTYDGVVLFHANTHVNLLTTALSSAELSVVRAAMRAQTPYNTTDEPLGPVNVPKLILVPNELEALAFRLCVSDTHLWAVANEDSNAPNPHKGMKYHVVDHWTDADNWFACADPNQVPMMEVGFYNGQEEPELWVQDMPNVGSQFDADKITYKIRHVWGIMLQDYRGFHRSSV